MAGGVGRAAAGDPRRGAGLRPPGLRRAVASVPSRGAAADSSPRREPCGWTGRNPPFPFRAAEGRKANGRAESYAPPGLRDIARRFPTAPALGYFLAPLRG